MTAIIEQYWPALVSLVLILVLAFFIWSRSRSSGQNGIRHYAPDILDEGASPAERNQAFIEAPSIAAAVAAPMAATGPDILGGIGEIAAWGAAQELAQVEPATAESLEQASHEVSQGRDDLTRIKGVGPKLAARLGELEITSFAQIAAWTNADLARIDPLLGPFAGRPVRDRWIAQCKLLAAGDMKQFAEQFGSL